MVFIKYLTINNGQSAAKEDFNMSENFYNKIDLFFPKKCNKCEEEKLQEEINLIFPNEYLILDSDGEMGKALIKHNNCGFCFSVSCFHDLLSKRNRGCPKCYQFKSLGEKAIMSFLEEQKIYYIPQKTFSPLNKSKYRFDFYIPKYNLAIEYQGEQHFRDNSFSNAVQKRDEIKRNYCKENKIDLLEISYKNYKKITQILTSKFNDYGENQ